MSHISEQQAVISHPVIVLKDLNVPLTTIGDFIISLEPLTVDQRAYLRNVARAGSGDVDQHLTTLRRTFLLNNYPFVWRRQGFYASLIKHSPHAQYESMVRIDTFRFEPYRFYQAVMDLGRMPDERTSLSHYKEIAVQLGMCYGPQDCPASWAERIKEQCLHMLSSTHHGLFPLQWEAYCYHVFLYRNCLKLEVGAHSNPSLTKMSPGERELRDHLVAVGVKHSEQDLVNMGAPASFIRCLRDLNVLLLADQKQAAVDRMANRQQYFEDTWRVMTGGSIGYEVTDVVMPMFPLEGLPLQGTYEVKAMRQLLEERVERLRLVQSYTPLQSLKDSSTIVRFWRLMNMAQDLAHYLEEALPLWMVCVDDSEDSKELLSDLYVDFTVRLRRQEERRKGECGLSGAPLYCLTFEDLLDIVKMFYQLMGQVLCSLQPLLSAFHLSIPSLTAMELHPAWPTPKWLEVHGFDASKYFVEMPKQPRIEGVYLDLRQF